MEINRERTILSHLLYNEQYARQVIPHVKAEYFSNEANRRVYKIIEQYANERGAIPTKEILHIELQNVKGIPENVFKEAKNTIDTLAVSDDSKKLAAEAKKQELDWLVDTTEEFCKQRAVYIALSNSAALIEKAGESKPGEQVLPESIPDMLADALSVGFDKTVGHDFLDDFSQRFEFYHSIEEQLPFDIEHFNSITKGGIPRKTLTAILAGTGVGKTLVMCHQAANNLMMGKNVLYITLEMADKKIAERIDANLMDVTMDDLKGMDKDTYDKKIGRIRERTVGKLIIKEYPTASASPLHFKALLKELRIKRGFAPDVIYVDYINLCLSSRFKGGAQVNSYTLIKAIAEELRGLAVEFNVRVVTATQTTRTGISSSDVDLTDTSESIGLPYTVDLMYAIIATEELSKKGQMMVKQLKNRFDDPNRMMRFLIGVDKTKMKLYNLEDSAQDGILNGIKKPGMGKPGQGPSVDDEIPLSEKFKRFGNPGRFGG